MLPVSQQIDQSLPGRGVLEDDRPHDQCGVFGVWAPGEDVSRLTYFSLYALQHRGQQSAGIAASDGSKILVYKDQGLVNQVFSEQSLQGLRGHIAVGHVRYATTGADVWENAQPTLGPTPDGTVALAHNGNLTNTDELRALAASIAQEGEDFQHGATTDTSLVTALLGMAEGMPGPRPFVAAPSVLSPGGGAAAMARMGYYLTYVTQELTEYQDPKEKDLPQDDFSDHPATERREAKLAEMLTAYSAGHVTVTDRRTVCIDGTPLLTATQTDEDYDNSPENAYLVAGALARAFHDYDRAEDWHIGLTDDGSVTMDGDPHVNELLVHFLAREKAGERLLTLVRDAYAGEAASGAREQLRAVEEKRAQAQEAARAEVENADAKAIQKMRENSDAYSDYGDSARALLLMERVFASPNDDSRAQSHVIRARAYAVQGDWEKARADADKGVADDPKDVLTWLNRSDVRRMMGDRVGALSDARKAIETDVKNPYGYLIAAELSDEMGNTEEAQAYFKKLYGVEPKALGRIPDEYLEAVDRRAYTKRMKEKEKARAEREKNIHEKRNEKHRSAEEGDAD